MPKNQARGSGEPAEIVGMIDQVARQCAVDRKRVYVAGLSAGASMTAILAACYSDVFAAAAIHDGTMLQIGFHAGYRLGTEAWACGEKRRLTVPVMVWHGQGDNIVNRDNADLIVRQFITLNDLADDLKLPRTLGAVGRKASRLLPCRWLRPAAIMNAIRGASNADLPMSGRGIAPAHGAVPPKT